MRCRPAPSPKSIGLLGDEAVGADLAGGARDGPLVAAVVDVLLEALERLHLRQGAPSVLGIVRGDVNEADAVVELERRVMKSGRPRLMQLGVDISDELFVLRRP